MWKINYILREKIHCCFNKNLGSKSKIQSSLFFGPQRFDTIRQKE